MSIWSKTRNYFSYRLKYFVNPLFSLEHTKMSVFHSFVNDHLVKYYQDIQNYTQITISLLKQKLLDYEQALFKIRTKLYGAYNEIHGFLVPLERKVDRFNKQVLASLQVMKSSGPYLLHDILVSIYSIEL